MRDFFSLPERLKELDKKVMEMLFLSDDIDAEM